MKPYGIGLKDRRRMTDYGADKYNSRGCFNGCNCHLCRNKKHKIREDNTRKKPGIMVDNIKRAAKKHIRQFFKRDVKSKLLD